jgi:hypothetical protein
MFILILTPTLIQGILDNPSPFRRKETVEKYYYVSRLRKSVTDDKSDGVSSDGLSKFPCTNLNTSPNTNTNTALTLILTLTVS